MINKMHEMYKNDRVTLDILQAAAVGIGELRKCAREIEQNRLLNFATFYLDLMENDLSMAETAAERGLRCGEIRNKLLNRGAVNIDGVRRICSVYGDVLKDVVYSPNTYSLTVLTQENTGAENVRMTTELREYVPAHILINYAEYLRTHREMKAYRHSELGGFRHSDVRGKVEL